MPSYKQHDNKSWSVRFRIVEGGQLKNKRLSGFSTKREAAEAQREFLQSYVPEEIIDQGEYDCLTFYQIVPMFLKYVSRIKKESTVYDYEVNINAKILPFFGNCVFFKTTKQDILKWQDELTDQGYSHSYKKKLRGQLSSIFEYGREYLNLPVNPVKECKPFIKLDDNPTLDTDFDEEINVWSEEEFSTFIKYIDDPLFYTLFTLLYYTGMRRGEILSLLWKDIDLKNQEIKIYKSITNKCKGSTYKLTTTKNKTSKRKILISSHLVKIISDYKGNQKSQSEHFVFGGSETIPFNTLNRKLKYYIELSGVKNIRLHDFRHSHASWLISKGANIVMVSKRLGHKNIVQTLNTYSHFMPNDDSVIRDILETAKKLLYLNCT